MKHEKLKIKLRSVIVCYNCIVPIKMGFVTNNRVCCLDCCAAAIIEKF